MKKIIIGAFVVCLTLFLVACNKDEMPEDAVINMDSRIRSLSVQSWTEAGSIEINTVAEDKEAKVYYSIFEKDTEKPSAADVKNGTDAIRSGNNTGSVYKIEKGLTKGETYLVAIVIETDGKYSPVQTRLTKTVEFDDLGLGTAEDPFKIRTIADLEKITTGEDGFTEDAYYSLENDLDLSDAGYGENLSWTPIGKQFGNSKKFGGVFNGNGHTIKNLHVEDFTGTEKWGLFAELNTYLGPSDDSHGRPSLIKDLVLEDVFVRSNGFRIGSVVGYSKGTLSNVSVIGGKVEGYDTGDTQVGGLVGTIYEMGTIINCYTDVTVEGSGRRVGGLVGSTDGALQEVSVNNSYFTGTVTGTTSGARQVGGIIGYAVDTNISNVYVSGNVEGDREVGGIAGYIQNKGNSASIKNSMFIGGTVKARGEVEETTRVGLLVGNMHSAFRAILEEQDAKIADGTIQAVDRSIYGLYSIDTAKVEGNNIKTSYEDTYANIETLTSADLTSSDFFSTNLPTWFFGDGGAWKFGVNRPVLIVSHKEDAGNIQTQTATSEVA